ncbi:hypothetical protein Q3C30_11715, partial [Enterococcus faecium]|nr:hypothetical protein [Enterococcus faecium]
IILFYPLFFNSVIPALILGIVGLIISIIGVIKNSSTCQKFLSIIGLWLNISPVLYFIFLYFSW